MWKYCPQFCNDILRESDKLNLKSTSVRTSKGEWEVYNSKSGVSLYGKKNAESWFDAQFQKKYVFFISSKIKYKNALHTYNIQN